MPTPAEPLPRLLRALLLAAERPLSVPDVVRLLAEAHDEEEWPDAPDAAAVEAALAAVTAELAGSGIEVARVGEGYRLRTATDLGPMVRRLWPDRVVRLGRAAMEVLAVVAYRQPCTRAEVEEVRGVDCGGLLKGLLERRLLSVVGRKDEPGRPLLYGTTPFFLETFSLSDLRSLPTLRDLAAMEAEEAARARGVAPVVSAVPVPDPALEEDPTADDEAPTDEPATDEPATDEPA
ncbi:MAG: SMC-Scp complex subunit ScpB [Myxococcales bacterium]|nr:SMC-Scp complex subunit ScpB [Myxococcales bacterium]